MTLLILFPLTLLLSLPIGEYAFVSTTRLTSPWNPSVIAEKNFYSAHTADISEKRKFSNRIQCLNALTERQMQFWEDVEEGLDDIESYFRKKGQNIDRIRQFGKR